MFTIREAGPRDAEALLELYTRHLTQSPPDNPGDIGEWRTLLAGFAREPGYIILIAEEESGVTSSVTLVVIKNLTHGMRPYALVENVVTRTDCRGRGYASRLLERATELAAKQGCYKIMLLTGAKDEGTLRFYERNGFNRNDKTGFVKWL